MASDSGRRPKGVVAMCSIFSPSGKGEPFADQAFLTCDSRSGRVWLSRPIEPVSIGVSLGLVPIADAGRKPAHLLRHLDLLNFGKRSRTQSTRDREVFAVEDSGLP